MNENAEIHRLADAFVALFPSLEGESRRAAVQIYRLLAKGEPVEPADVAAAAGLPPERVREILADWPGVYYEDDRIIGFWGLTPRPSSQHLFQVDGRTLYTWCAWDTLFIPQILGKTAQVETPCPVTGETIRLTVTPERVERTAPESAVMSILDPPENILEDIVSKFCHYVFFFASTDAGGQWTDENPGTRLMSIPDAFELGRLKNLRRFGDALG